MKLFQTTPTTLRALCLGCAFTFALSAQAASFDCAKASTKVEHIICDDPEISKLDDELSVAYKTAVQDEDEKQAKVIRQSQMKWMKYRNNCKVALCIKGAYEIRLTSLTVTHIYTFPLGDTEAEQKTAVYTAGSIDMRKPGYPFKLKEGKGVEVCEVYQKNLEALGNPNLACERKVSPKYKGIIKLPKWRKLDFFENRNLWNQVERMANGEVCDPIRMESRNNPNDDQRTIDELAERYQANIQRYNTELYKLNVVDMDVDNDGKSELVLREHSGLCGEHTHYHSVALFVLNEKGDTVDLQKTRPLFQDPCFDPKTIKPSEQVYGFSNGEMYDVFFYKDKTYLDRWTWSGIWIYGISNGETQAICHLK